MLTSGVLHHFNVQQQEDGGFSTSTSLHYKALLNPSMQIHVQNVPFVYNPDTISVGLGFSKAKKSLQYTTLKNSVLCSVCCLSPIAFYVTSHLKADQGLLQKNFEHMLKCDSAGPAVFFSTRVSLHGKAD